MTRLFGCICNQPQRITEVLEPVRSVLTAPPPVARWGLGYVQAGQVLLNRHPRVSEAPVDFFDALGKVKSDYVVGSICDADGLKGNANTPPFRFRRWMFAHEGTMANADEIIPPISDHLPGFLKRNVKGKMASEYVFHLFLSMLHDSGNMDDPNLDLAIIRRAMRDAIAFVKTTLSKTGVEAEIGNMIVTNSRSMLAVRMGGPLHVRWLKHTQDPRRPESEFRAVLTVSMAKDAEPGPGFEEIPMGSVASIQREVTMEIVDLSA